MGNGVWSRSSVLLHSSSRWSPLFPRFSRLSWCSGLNPRSTVCRTSSRSLVSLFLDTSVHLTLAEACKRDSMRLQGRIWQNSQAFVGDDSDAPWSIHKFTRTDPFYLQFQWTLALKEAIRLENLDMIQWLFAEF
ncbi:Pre-mRNA-splicing factor 38B [Phytophthora cinnamomi]|uniref:Pre-mRNA-splicing factor 38B n=1 Tax=Phytophthora cinnamomi TaxID=4785 RepID=UPI00355A950F|nr:Pre-mRNA-splicing factor 38B [Phytophthora cinnamomi]